MKCFDQEQIDEINLRKWFRVTAGIVDMLDGSMKPCNETADCFSWVHLQILKVFLFIKLILHCSRCI